MGSIKSPKTVEKIFDFFSLNRPALSRYVGLVSDFLVINQSISFYPDQMTIPQ